uniref:Cytochrome c oxidase subunit 3 n=1 Tax=Vallicula multiformis TaxID=140489 RepID=A0A2R4ZJ82_9METZ|nr:cytochrome c oxidase subunit III [Vallicula multiformis]
MFTHIKPSYFPFFITFALFLFFFLIIISIVFSGNTFREALGFFSLLSLLFFFKYRSELTDYSNYQFFLNAQYFIFFIFSEVCFFFGVFWAVFWGFYSYDYYNSNFIPFNIAFSLIFPYGLPLLNTLLLLSSACFATIYHESYLSYVRDNSLYICFIFGVIFLYIQFIEFSFASYTISSTSFGSLFFFSTGFHGFHVLVGLFFIFLYIYSNYIISIFRKVKFYLDNFLNLALLYWHFVDVVWLFLFTFVYSVLFHL